MKKVSIGVKEVGKDLRFDEVEVGRQSFCGIVRKYIDDALDWLPIKGYRGNEVNKLLMVFDDNGLYKDLPINFYYESGNRLAPFYKIFGTVVFIRIEELYDEDGTTIIHSLTDDDKKYLFELLSPSSQNHLKECFDNMGESLYDKGGIVTYGLEDLEKELNALFGFEEE